MHTFLITGGAGFIGSNFVHYLLEKYPNYRVVVFDKLTYAGNLDNLRDLDDERFQFVRGDICDASAVEDAIRKYEIDTLVNFAAETHVDRSILDADAFIQTNVFGTYVLLEAAKKFGLERYHQISTDEVYGWVQEGASNESDPVQPRSPYAAAKASGDLLALSYFVTHQLPVTITRGSNTVGPYQYPEKLAPLFITNAIADEPLPLYGDGQQVRDWLYVRDHCEGIDIVLHKGKPGEVYNVGGDNERRNVEVVKIILEKLNKPATLVRSVPDRPGHDRRYALDISKIGQLGWQPRHSFEQALTETIEWYVENEWWWRKLKSGEYREYYQRQYAERLQNSVAAKV